MIALLTTNILFGIHSVGTSIYVIFIAKLSLVYLIDMTLIAEKLLKEDESEE